MGQQDESLIARSLSPRIRFRNRYLVTRRSGVKVRAHAILSQDCITDSCSVVTRHHVPEDQTSCPQANMRVAEEALDKILSARRAEEAELEKVS